MADPSALFACTKCNARHPFEELSQSEQLCKECRNNYPVVKCTYCRAEFQQGKGSTNTICRKCAQNVKAYGKPTACEYCNVIAAFIGNRCQRCTNSEKKWGSPVTCEQCKQKCAFDRSEESTGKVDGKILCWLCTLAYRRVLAKTRKHQEDSIKNYGNFSESLGSSSRPITVEGGSSSRPITVEGGSSSSSERNTDSKRQEGGKASGSRENRSQSVEKNVTSGDQDKHSSTDDKLGSKEKHERSDSGERRHHHHHHRHGSSDHHGHHEKGKDHHKSHKSKSHHSSNRKHDKSHEHSSSKKAKLETTPVTTPVSKSTSTNGVTPTKSTSVITSIASLSDKSFSDPNSTDHMIAITQLREELEALKKQLQGKDQQIKEKEKKITELKAFQYESEKDFRTKITNLQKQHSDANETLQSKNRDLMKQVASLSKGNKGNRGVNSPSL